jgi:radical SAM superfamily enzyme YgiQ (UPF0313 family)
MLKQAGHETDVHIIQEKTKIGKLGLKNVDVVAFSSSTPTFKDDIKIAEEIKQRYPDKFIIFGGAHPTFYPEETKKQNCIDSICIGEGYEAIVRCADGEIKDVYTTTEKYDINKLPRPDYELYYKKYKVLREKKTKQVYIVHGCPYRCSFCWNEAYNKIYKGKVVQCMDVEKAVDEILWLKKRYGFEWLQFISDNMTVNKDWLKRFLVMYKRKVNKPYLMNIRCNEINEELVTMLKLSGCERVDFGLEHGNEEIRNDVLQRNMKEEDILKAGKLMHRFDIRFQTSNIVGMPIDTLKKSIETVKLNQAIKPEIAKCCIYQPFEGTSLYKLAKEKGLLKDLDKITGTTIQEGFDGRGEGTKVILKDEKKLVRLSYLFDFFVQNKWLNPLIGIICSLPLNWLYRKYYAWRFAKQEKMYG